MDLEKFLKEHKQNYNSIVLDLDNCLFDSRVLAQYVPENKLSREGWDEFHKHYTETVPNNEMVLFIKELIEKRHLKEIIILTSREDVGNTRKITETKIMEAFKPISYLLENVELKMLMRQFEDYRSSQDVKQSMLMTIFKKIDLAIDDDKENIQMYKNNNIQTIHYDNFGSESL